ncbi:Pho80p cyclin [Elasticomyces elasticus]|nr:Pho80p cyclin [Elasticomyces elasticus]
MSTLTSSPSPTLSGPPSVYHSRSSYYRQAPSPRSLPVNSPSSRRSNALTAPSSAPSARSPQPSTKKETDSESSSPILRRTADAWTQYTPPGLPPTSRAMPGALDTVTGSKRKESSRSPLLEVSSSGPAEPEPRVDPDAVQAPSPTQLPARPAAQQTLSSKRARAPKMDVKIMPRRYETCATKDLGILISDMLMELLRINDPIPLRDGQLTRFHSRAPPAISIRDYLARLILHATLSPPLLLTIVFYIDRLCGLYPAFTITSLTVHRFLITAATVAAKGLSDAFWTNPTYARVGGIPVSELATLELEFLQRMDWRIVPAPEVLEEYYASLIERNAAYMLEGTTAATEAEMDDDKGR